MKHDTAPFVILLLALAACGQSGTRPQTDGAGHVTIVDLGEGSLVGAWTGADGGDCAAPDFRISRDRQTDDEGLAVAANFNGWDQTGRLPAGGDRITFIDPTKRLPVALEDGGLRVSAPADGAAVLGTRNIFDKGVLFLKCAD